MCSGCCGLRESPIPWVFIVEFCFKILAWLMLTGQCGSIPALCARKPHGCCSMSAKSG